MKAALFSVPLKAGQLGSCPCFFLTNENMLFEVAKCRRTNYFTGNGKHFPATVKVLVPFTLRLYQIENLFNSFTADEIREIQTYQSFMAAALSLFLILLP